MFEYLLTVKDCGIKSLCPVDHEQSVVPIGLLRFPEDDVVIDVSHLPRQLSDGVLAVAEKVIQSRLIFPIYCFLLKKGLDVDDFVLREDLNVSLSVRF